MSKTVEERFRIARKIYQVNKQLGFAFTDMKSACSIYVRRGRQGESIAELREWEDECKLTFDRVKTLRNELVRLYHEAGISVDQLLRHDFFRAEKEIECIQGLVGTPSYRLS